MPTSMNTKPRREIGTVPAGATMTRTHLTDRMKIGTVGWHKEGHLVILVQKTARGFKRLQILQTREDDLGGIGWWDPKRIRKGVFSISDGTLLLTNRRVRELEKNLDVRGKRQIRKQQ